MMSGEYTCPNGDVGGQGLLAFEALLSRRGLEKGQLRERKEGLGEPNESKSFT